MDQNELLKHLAIPTKPGESYSQVVRDFCISIHFHSPKAYTVLRDKLQKRIPHPHTIAAWYRNSNVHSEPGFHPSTFERLKNIVSDMKPKDSKDSKPLVCTLIADEMYIRKQVLWSNQTQKYCGYVSYGVSDEQKLLPVANQAIVFMLSGLNRTFEFPLGYHFIKSLKTNDKTALFQEVIEKVTKCGIVIANITFDGLVTNFTMCAQLGAKLNPYSPEFKPYILNPLNESKIFIMIDSCHAEKLARNTLGNKLIIYDESNNPIKWQHIVDLERFSAQNELHTHKLNKKHIQFKGSVMDVRIASETLSNSVADTLQFLSDKGVQEFQNVQGTICYARFWNNLFDIFNTRSTRSKQIFKRALSSENKDAIFAFLDEATNYLKSLKIDVPTKKNSKRFKRVSLANSRNGTAYRGILINIASLKEMYKEFVEEKKYMNVFYTYAMSQDHLEMFFGKIR